MNYRDETETLRAELLRTSSELAKANAELARRNVEPRTEVVFRDENGWLLDSVVGVLVFLAGISIFSIFAGVAAPVSMRNSTVLIAIGVSSAVLWALLYWRSLPRREVRA